MKRFVFIIFSLIMLTGCNPAIDFGTKNETNYKEGTTDQIPVKLVSVTDGDTIRIQYKGKEEAVRYLLIDTPETHHPRLGKQPFGEEAKARNKELLKNGDMTIEFDVGQKRDKYDRLLCYVYVNGKSVQEALLSEGYARVAYVYPPNTRYLDDFEAAQDVAKKKQIGVWKFDDYATDRGFDSEQVPDGEHVDIPVTKPSSGTKLFKNCTELRKVYPNGVNASHPAYSTRMDGDKDGYACE